MEKLGKALRFLNKGNKLEYFINLIRKHAHGFLQNGKQRQEKRKSRTHYLCIYPKASNI